MNSELPLEHFIYNELISKIKIPEHATLKELNLLEIYTEKNPRVIFELKIEILGKQIVKKQTIDLDIRERRCPNCARNTAKSHRAILQIRSEKPIEFIQKLSKVISKYKKQIIKTKEFKKGFDFYFANRSTALKLASEMKKKVKVKMSETSKAKGWDRTKNKPKYISTILLRERN